jgi:hypothetical protein
MRLVDHGYCPYHAEVVTDSARHVDGFSVDKGDKLRSISVTDTSFSVWRVIFWNT